MCVSGNYKILTSFPPDGEFRVMPSFLLCVRFVRSLRPIAFDWKEKLDFTLPTFVYPFPNLTGNSFAWFQIYSALSGGGIAISGVCLVRRLGQASPENTTVCQICVFFDQTSKNCHF